MSRSNTSNTSALRIDASGLPQSTTAPFVSVRRTADDDSASMLATCPRNCRGKERATVNEASAELNWVIRFLNR